ncbi:MAG: leucine-rich repeat domain-containing protein [Blautia sp.]|nr:leucine-rich repeat domain-containing protein [Blautia sp.]
MKIYYRIRKDNIEIVRCYGTEPEVVIPSEINGKTVTSVAAYAFSGHYSEESENVCLWESGDNFISGREEHLLADSAIEKVVFPESLKEIGRYIFYGCSRLKSLEFSDNLVQIGCGAFTGCHNLEKLMIHMKNGHQTCAKEILGELWQRIDLDLLYEKEDNDFQEARLVFPEHYDEAVENTPARILMTQYHGSGGSYRQCFYNRILNYREYDRLFSMAKVMDNLEVLVDMCFDRLEFPYELSEDARGEYVGYVRENLSEIASYLVRNQDLHRLQQLSDKKLWNENGLETALDVAACQKDTEIAAYLMNEREKLAEKNPVHKKKRFAL